MKPSTLIPGILSWQRVNRRMALPGEMQQQYHPDADDTEAGRYRMICDTARPSRHSYEESCHSATRRHRNHTSHSKKRRCRPEQQIEQCPTDVLEVDPTTLALVEQYVRQAAFEVQMSATEAQAVQLKLAESHAEVTALLTTTQNSVCREREQVELSNQLRSQLEARWTELHASAVAATEITRNEATEKCQLVATQCHEMMQKVAHEADALVREANRRTQEQIEGCAKIEMAYEELLPGIKNT